MTTREQYILSIYQELTDLGSHNNIKLVKNTLDGMLYVKKSLNNYNIDVYKRLKEAEIPGVPKIFEIIRDEENLIVIEEYINGKTPININEKNIEIEKSKAIVVALCDVLYKLHNLNPPIVHRDIKPDNVIITNEGNVYLVDFNISRQVVNNKNKDTVIMGTSGYAAPEQFGFAQTDCRTDIYSLGMLLKNITDIRENTKDKEEIKLQRIIEKCTWMDPEARYQNVEELKSDILGQKESEGTESMQIESFLPPGFRSGKIENMIKAIIGYVLIILMSRSFKSEEGKVEDLIYTQSAFFNMCIGFVFSFYNWRGMHDNLPEIFRKNIILKTATGVVVAIVCIVLTTIVATIIDY